MDLQQARRRARLTIFGACATAVLLLGTASAALAASSTAEHDCDSIARNLKSLDVAGESLALDIVEHMVENGEEQFDAPREPAVESEAVAPVLLLTPRVATILREVFGSKVASETPDDGESAPSADDEQPMPPVARDETAEELPTSIAPALRDAFQNRYMPRFQRQMYRTDI